MGTVTVSQEHGGRCTVLGLRVSHTALKAGPREGALGPACSIPVLHSLGHRGVHGAREPVQILLLADLQILGERVPFSTLRWEGNNNNANNSSNNSYYYYVSLGIPA